MSVMHAETLYGSAISDSKVLLILLLLLLLLVVVVVVVVVYGDYEVWLDSSITTDVDG